MLCMLCVSYVLCIICLTSVIYVHNIFISNTYIYILFTSWKHLVFYPQYLTLILPHFLWFCGQISLSFNNKIFRATAQSLLCWLNGVWLKTPATQVNTQKHTHVCTSSFHLYSISKYRWGFFKFEDSNILFNIWDI